MLRPPLWPNSAGYNSCSSQQCTFCTHHKSFFPSSGTACLLQRPRKILRECKESLLPELLIQIKRVLYHNNPTKFIGHIAAEQCMQSRDFGNHASLSNSITKVENNLSKEERNKCAALFPCPLKQSSQAFISPCDVWFAKKEKTIVSFSMDLFWRHDSPPAFTNLHQHKTKLNCTTEYPWKVTSRRSIACECPLQTRRLWSSTTTLQEFSTIWNCTHKNQKTTRTPSAKHSAL